VERNFSPTPPIVCRYPTRPPSLDLIEAIEYELISFRCRSFALFSIKKISLAPHTLPELLLLAAIDSDNSEARLALEGGRLVGKTLELLISLLKIYSNF
jgi:hypothetical protein